MRAMKADLVRDAATCPSCGRDGLLAVEIPYPAMVPAERRPVRPSRAVLCEACSLDDPYAAALVVFFTVHGSVQEHTVEQFARLLRRWIEHLDAPRIADDAVAADLDAWRNGHFD